METESPVGRQCRKCNHVRKRTDTGPDWACPACGAAYLKIQAIVNEREAEAREAARNPTWKQPEDDEPPPPPPPPATLAEERRRVALARFAYGLLALPLVLTWVAAALVARGLASEPGWLAAHARWQLRTFWTAVVVGLVIAFIALIALGGLALSRRMAGGGASGGSGAGWLWLPVVGLWLWMLYRTAIGWLLLQRGDSPL